jgi:recombinational DNA repair ATPase RecF
MKLDRMRTRNFGKFTDFECVFDGKVTRLVGLNGSGKTTVGLILIWAGLKGIAEKSRDGQLVGERFRFIGNAGKSADIEITIIDEQNGNAKIKTRNHITKASNDITFEAPSGYKINDDWLKHFLNMSFLSAKHFTSLDGKAQALALGIDTSKFDEQIAETKSRATVLRAEVKAFGELVEVEKVEPVDMARLLAQRDAVLTFNSGQTEKAAAIDKAIEQVKLLEKEKADLIKQLNELQELIKQTDTRIAKGKQYIKGLPKAEEFKDTGEIDSQIQNAQETDRQAQVYKTYLKQSEAKAAKQTELDGEIRAQGKISSSRLEYIKNFEFGFQGLSVDEDGKLLLNEKPIKEPYFSRGEIELIVAKLHAAVVKDDKKAFRVRFIDDFEGLDDKNQTKILKVLDDAGFQIITAEVGDEVVKGNTLLLRECKLVKNGKQEQLL